MNDNLGTISDLLLAFCDYTYGRGKAIQNDDICNKLSKLAEKAVDAAKHGTMVPYNEF
jgi:hypothetical protein